MSGITLMEEIALLLADCDLGTYRPDSTDGTIYLLQLPQTPPSPEVAMAIAAYPGGDGDAGLAYDKLRFQIRCRGSKNDKTAGYRLATAVWDALQGMGSRYLPGGTWLVQALGVSSGPGYVGSDQNGRDEHVVNVEFEVHTNARRARA